MTLGEQIHALRTQKSMSQGELAEALNVTRQSVSKWETDASVPELEKLLALSSLFDVTLDELVRGEKAEGCAQTEAAMQTNVPQPETPERNTASTGRRIVGVILLCFGAVILLLCALLGDVLIGLLFASPFVLCGVLCLTVRRNTGLWCAWAAVGCVLMYFYFATGITWRMTLLTARFTAQMNYMRLAIAWVELAALLLMIVLTAVRFSKKPMQPVRKSVILLALAWCAVIAWFVVPLPLPKLRNGNVQFFVYFFLADAPRTAALTALLTQSIRLVRGVRNAKT